MAFNKCECFDGQTVITAKMMNDIQDAICGLEGSVSTLDGSLQDLREEVDALPEGGSGGLDHMPTAEEVGARPDTWLPTPEEIGARPDTWTPTAAEVGARPDTWTPSAADVGARPSNWLPTPEEIGAATPADVAAAVRKAAPWNLLDNSDFTNPVNQRSITTVTANGYTIDRWRTYHDNDSVTVSDGYVSLSARLYQPIQASSLDLTKTYTAAAMKTDGTLLVNVLHGIAEEAPGNPTVYLSGQLALFRLDDGGDFLWAALYEGEYTVETLPEYRSKGYGAELRECRRYYQIFNDYSGVLGTYMYAHYIRGYVKFEPMRVYSPTITMTQSQYLAPSGSADWADFSPAAAISGNTVTISGTVGTLTVGLSCMMRLGFTLSAEL